MKLSVALAMRADLNTRIAELQKRMTSSALVQEGTPAPENAMELLAQADELADQLQSLIAQINKTNIATLLADRRTLTEAIAERDILLVRIRMHRELADAAIIKQNIHTRSEVRFIPQVNITELRKKADSLSRQHRELDAQIQEANFSTDLIE